MEHRSPPHGLDPGAAGQKLALLVLLLASTGCSRAESAAVVAPEAASGAAPAAAPVAAARVPEVRYDRDIRPILSDRCLRCHGPDGGQRQAGLRLDERASATAPRDGRPAIAPGDPEGSELWRRVSSADPDLRMPPPESHRKPLSDGERELVRAWIEQGAGYEAHWSFVPPVRPSPPAMSRPDWPSNPVDEFILAQWDAQGIAPGPEADPATLARRLFLDLTGLPPTPEERAAFVADERPEALAALADRLLGEEPWVSRHAERMASPWMDAARYADTSGIHTDAGREMWLWRDWVLAAYRDNLPFDAFLTEQLAGDLLPDASDEQRIASGFNRNHVTTDEGGAIPEEYLVEYAVDRAATTASVFLGLTLGCARCHDHKFDPISQAEFFGFYAYFNSQDEPGLYSQLPDPRRAFEPYLEVPTEEQREERAALDRRREVLAEALDHPVAGDDVEREAFVAELATSAGLAWEFPPVGAARSTGGATLTPDADGSVHAGGANPDQDTQVLTLRTEAVDLRLLLLEVLPDASGRIGRAANGNALLTGLAVEARSLADPSQRRAPRLTWAWADHAQADGDHAVTHALLGSDELGWAVDGHQRPGGRLALFLWDEPVGFPGGTEIEVSLEYASVHAQHVLARIRLGLGRLSQEGLARLPVVAGPWRLVGPFPADSGAAAFDTAFGPETDLLLDATRNFGAGNQVWRADPSLADDQLNGDLPKGVNATYVGRWLHVPSPRRVEIALGSDDGFRLFVSGREVASRQVDRSLAADQDRVTLDLVAGAHALVLKVANTAGDGGFAWSPRPEVAALSGDLVAALLPAAARGGELDERVTRAWRTQVSPRWRGLAAELDALEQREAALAALIPRTMVMRELPQPRPTFVLSRGQYDQPDAARPVARGVPAALGALPSDAPADRRGLARWMVGPDNPLVARVAVNRLWELVFGTGLVATSEDFGLQGEWPSHPELLDWLAVEFQESGWDSRHILRLLVTSATWRQASTLRTGILARDPGNRWLSWFPRLRLPAEAIRDQALYVSGLLVESFGGPSVKPYQPEGLWQEVAMPASNTRLYERGQGSDLWRRSLYTYWKRASPPPGLASFDAPTRESCTIRRTTTTTPLQALVLWNDEQFVEAARALAQRTLAEAAGDEPRLQRMFARCRGRDAAADELAPLHAALAEFRTRYAAAPEAAEALLAVGEAERATDAPPTELAAWTLVASALLQLDGTLTRG